MGLVEYGVWSGATVRVLGRTALSRGSVPVVLVPLCELPTAFPIQPCS
jgi:hypothetical protein